MKMFLWRKFSNPEYRIGDIVIDGDHFSDTLERPWKDNAPGISCIPIGSYKVKMMPSAHFKRMLPHILDVPGRSEIMIHPVNAVHESLGCIGVGRNTVKGGLTESRKYSDQLNALITAAEARGEAVEINIV